MSKAIPMVSGGVTFLVEADETVAVPKSHAPARPSGVPAGMDAVADMGQMARQFADVQGLIVTCCNSLYEALARVPNPEKVEVEFGVKLGGEAGVPMLTKATGEANFRVVVEWKPAKPTA